MQRICVYCGSSPGDDAEFIRQAHTLGEELVRRNLALVYGGGSVGLMGHVAEAVLAAGGEVVGVITEQLVTMELGHQGLTQLHVVGTMHERKARMAELADAFIAMPGGFGTLEEIFEALTWQQLGIHAKPCGLLNVAGYYDSLIAFLDGAVTQKFIKSEHRQLVVVDTAPAALLDKLASFQSPPVDKAEWIRSLKL